jgi:hypothetical protein
MRIAYVLLVLIACKSKDKPAPVVEATPPPVVADASAPVAVDAAAAAVPAKLAVLCVDFDQVAKDAAIDEEQAVETKRDVDVDGDGKQDAIVSIQWKAIVHSHLFVDINDKCGRPIGTVEGDVEEVVAGTPRKLRTTAPSGDAEYSLIDGRFAKTADDAPLAVQSLRWLGFVAAIHDKRAATELDAQAFRRAGDSFATLVDGGPMFKNAAADLRKLVLAKKADSAFAPGLDKLQRAFAAVADAVERAAPMIEDKPREAWALVTPAANAAQAAANELIAALQKP